MSTQPIEIAPAFGGDDLATLLEERREAPIVWTEPTIYDAADPADAQALKQALASGEITTVRDGVDAIAGELFEYEQPGLKNDDMAREAYASTITEQGVEYGKWVHFPWAQSLVRFPDQEQHRALRTSRNRNLVTDAEQDKLYEAKVAVFGLSVGSNIVEKLVLSGIGGTIIMGDPDHISPTNLNRITGSFHDVGAAKIDHMARKISESDPYIEQVHFREGFTPEATDALASIGPDLIFDEVDNLPAKAQMRAFAKEQGIPLIMATDLGDRSLIDVERHDLEDVKPFGGRLKTAEYEALLDGTVSDEERMKLTTRIVGLRHVTTRMLQSVAKIDTELSGMPQLGVAASAGGALSAIAAREIILGRNLPSGRYVLSPKEILGLDPQASVREFIAAARELKAGK